MYTLLIVAGIPTAVTGFCFWMLERIISKKSAEDEEKRKKRQRDHDERSNKRDELQYLLIESVNASIALGEATAKAVERIPDAHCNGDMHEALEYAVRVKRQQKELLGKRGIKQLGDEL